MNLLQFVEMGLAESLLLSAACFIVCCLMSGLGSLFIQGEKKLVLQAFVGLSLTASLSLISVSICAIAAKYIILICIAASVVLTVKRVVLGELNFKNVLWSYAPALIAYSLFIALLMAYIFSHVGTVDYNCHMIYCSAIPEEIFKADYFSRIRIVDVYPYEWSKFHMFNGCMTAVPLAVFPLKNIVTFNLAKFATIAILIGVVHESLVRMHGAASGAVLITMVLMMLFTCASFGIRWTLFINNYSSFFIMGIAWLSLREGDYREAAIASTILALATSKSTVTGMLFFVFSLYMLSGRHGSIKRTIQKEYKAAIFCFFLVLACFCMLFTGDAPANETLFHPNFISNTTNKSWLALFYASQPLNSFISDGTFGTTWWGLLIIFFYGISLWVHRATIIDFVRRYKTILCYVVVVVFSMYLAYWANLNGGSLAFTKKILSIPLLYCFLYLIPITCLFACCEKSMYKPARLFIIFAFIQFMVLNVDNGACNYSLLMLPLTIYLAEDTFALVKGVSPKAVIALLLALFTCTIVSNLSMKTDLAFIMFGSETDYYHTKIELAQTDYLGVVPYEYYEPGDSVAVMLNSFKGNRIHYNVPVDQSDEVLGKMSMSMRFVPVGS